MESFLRICPSLLFHSVSEGNAIPADLIQFEFLSLEAQNESGARSGALSLLQTLVARVGSCLRDAQDEMTTKL